MDLKNIKQGNLSFTGKKSKNKPKKLNKSWTRITAIVLSVILLAYFVCALTAGIGIYAYRWDNKFSQALSKIFPYPAAIVGSEIITMDTLNREVGYIQYFYEKTAPDQIPEYSIIEKQVLDRLVAAIVVKKLASANGVGVDNQEVDEQFDQIAEENGGEEKVSQILSDLYGLDIPTFKRFIKEQLLQEKLKEKFDDELQLQVKARHILVKVAPDADEATKEAARVKAQGLLDQINAGADFTEIAKAHSEDEASQGQGGELPYFSKGQNVKEFEEAAFSLEPGEISELVLTQYGFHIIKVEEKRGNINMTFEEWLESEEESLWVIRFVARDEDLSSSESVENGENIEGETTEGQ